MQTADEGSYQISGSSLTRVILLVSAVGLSFSLGPGASHGQCIDYGDYLHWVTSMPGTPPSDVVVSGGYLYVAGGEELQVIDLVVPISPVVVGSVSTPDNPNGVAVSGSTAYVAAGHSGLHVVDVSSPDSPTIVGSVPTPGYGVSVVVSGSYAYVADYSSGLQVVDVSDSTSPQVVGGVDTPDYAIRVAVSGSYAYVTVGPNTVEGSGLLVVDISDPEFPTIVASIPSAALDVEVSGSYAYVANAGYNADAGLQVLDVSNPESPTIVATVPADVESRRVAVSGSYAYVLGWRLQVVDVSNPESPEIVGFADMGYDGMWPWWLSGNFCVAVSESHAYVGLYTGAGGLHVVDISNPASPPTVGVVGTPGRPMDVEVSGSTAYVARLHAGLQVVDVSDPASPALVGSPYMRGSALAVAVSGSYAYVAAGSYRGCLQHESIPAPDGSEPGFLGQRDGVPRPRTRAGLQVFDVSDPAFPVRAGCVYIPDAPNKPENVAYDVAVSGSYAYVAATSGLHVVDISNPYSPTIVGSVPPESWGFPVRVAVSESHAYVVFTGFYQGWNTGPTWLEVVDVVDPVSPVSVGSVEMPGAAWGVALSGSHAYIAGRQWETDKRPNGQGGLRVVNISDPTSPEIVRTVATWCDYSDVVVSGRYAYVTADYWGWFGKLHVWDISALTAPETSGVVGEIGVGSAHAVTVSGDYVYVATEGGLRVFPIQCPQAVPAQAALASPGFAELDGRPGLHLAIPAPNPVSTRTGLSFFLPTRQHARLVLYDVAGRRVRTLVDRMLPEGAHSATWNARDHSGRRVAPGTYFVSLQAAGETVTRKVVFLGGK